MPDDIGLAEALLGLQGFRVLAVYEEPAELSVVVETLAAEIMFCRGCGGRAEAHDRMSVQLRDLPCFGRPVRLVWRKRVACPEPWCGNRTWTEECEAARPRLLMTARAGRELTRQVGELARPVSSVARENGLAWGTVMSAVRYYGQPLVDASDRVSRVRAAGLDETKFLSADGRRATQYVTSVVDLDRCKIIDLVEGNSADDISRWCTSRPRGFLRAITVVATDLTESYRAGITPYLDHALRVADPFHVVRLANRAVDQVRRRVQNQVIGHRGRKHDPLFRIRKLLDSGAERLGEYGYQRLLLGLRIGDPDQEVLGAWLAKESVREVYLSEDVEEAATLLDKAIVGCRQDAFLSSVLSGERSSDGGSRPSTITARAPATVPPRA